MCVPFDTLSWYTRILEKLSFYTKEQQKNGSFCFV